MDQQLLTAMQLADSGNWSGAHEIVQDRQDPSACRIHGYLHRVEGDESNARYWYRQAGCPFPTVSLAEEARQIVQHLKTADD